MPKKQKKAKAFSIQVPIIDRYVCMGSDLLAMKAQMEKDPPAYPVDLSSFDEWATSDEMRATDGLSMRFYSPDNLEQLSAFGLYIEPGARPGIIVHECVHLAHNMLSYIDHKADYSNDEIEAYLTDYLFTLFGENIDYE